MPDHERIPLAALPRLFVMTDADQHRNVGETRSSHLDRCRFVLWQATGVIIHDTDFGSGSDLARSRVWFPPCTRVMDPAWWAAMRLAAERVQESLRTGIDLGARNFAEQVVIEAVLRSDAPEEILSSLPEAQPALELVSEIAAEWGIEREAYTVLFRISDDDWNEVSKLESVLFGALDNSRLKTLFLDDFRPAPVPVTPPSPNEMRQWFRAT